MVIGAGRIRMGSTSPSCRYTTWWASAPARRRSMIPASSAGARRERACCTRLARASPARPRSSAGVSIVRSVRRRVHVYVTPGPFRRNDGPAHLTEGLMHADKAYDELMRRVREETLLTGIEALLEWDEETYMPSGGVENRSEQLALVAGLLHERGTDPRLGELLAAVEGSSLLTDPAPPAAVNVRAVRREYDRFVRLPRQLVEDVARTTVLAQKAWADARAAADFARFQPWLERIVALKRQEAECVGYADEPYDALLEDYEPGLRSRVVGRLFAALRRELVPLAGRIAGAARRPEASVLRRHFPRDRQRRFGERVAAAVGFDFSRGRMDLGVHPSCTGVGAGD